MTIELEASPTSTPARRTNSAPANFALAVCSEAWTRAHQAAMTSNIGRNQAAFQAAEAYRRAMPTLCGSENIMPFIACVAHGILIGAIDCRLASRLLYAAQVAKTALSALRQDSTPA